VDILKKLTADSSQGTLVVVRCRIFCLPVYYNKNINIMTCRTIILPVVLYGC